MSLEKDFREKIHEANVSIHRIEAKYYELIHPEVYGSHEQKRITSTLETVDNILRKNQGRAI